MPRNPNLPRGRVDVKCNACGEYYEFFNHESCYVANKTDLCPHCGACDYKRAWRSFPHMWGIDHEWERWHKTFRDPLNLPNREPISYSKAMAYAAVHHKATGEQVTAEDVLKEVNTVYHGMPISKTGGNPSNGATRNAS